MKILAINSDRVNENHLCALDVPHDDAVLSRQSVKQALKSSGMDSVYEFSVTRMSPICEYGAIVFVRGKHNKFRKAQPSEFDAEIQSEINNYTLYKKALGFAVDYHGNQKYTVLNLPYSFHLRQTDRVIDNFSCELPVGKTSILKAASILHDTLEDTHATRALLEREFGKEITDAVARVTKIDEKNTPEYEATYYDQVAGSPLSVLVKMADKCANAKQTLRTYSEWHANRMIGGHGVFKEKTYGIIECPNFKSHLDKLIMKLES